MIPLFQIGFLPIRIWDAIDVFIVGYLLYQIYKLLKGSLAFNIFIGVVAVLALWQIVKMLNMELTATVFEQFASVGIIMLIIVFQPEIRRFLLLLGNSTLAQRYNFFDRWIATKVDDTSEHQLHTQAIKAAILRMSKDKTGALIVLSNNLHLETLAGTGVIMNANISQPLIESIFNKKSPLHDGAIIISGGKIYAASCVLPISSNTKLPKSAGLRHRAAVGATENTNIAVFIVSEENGRIAFSHKGKLQRNLSETQLTELLLEHYV